MIQDRWYAILESTELRRGQTLGVRRLGHDLVVWRCEHGSERVVLTQRPVASRLRMDEKLIPGDRPLVEFRRRREELEGV